MIYLASPYSHPDPAVRRDRFYEVCRHAAGMIREGHVVYAPIAHTHPIAVSADDPLPEGWAFWQRLDLPLLAAAREVRVLRLPGWMTSEGVGEEIAWALRMNKPVVYVDPVPAPTPIGGSHG